MKIIAQELSAKKSIIISLADNKFSFKHHERKLDGKYYKKFSKSDWRQAKNLL